MENKVIVGAMCVSGLPEILNISIPNLIKHSDYVLLLLDNETEELKELVLNYQRQYYDKVFVRRSSIQSQIIGRGGEFVGYRARWKSVKAIVRDEIFVNLKRMIYMRLIPDISILLFPDADEIFTDSLPELLATLRSTDYRGVSLKMVHAVNDLFTIKQDNMMHHFHIMKWSKDLCGIPWQNFNLFHPIVNNDIMKVENYSVHLCYLTEKQRAWRNDNWKGNDLIGSNLWRLPKIVTEMSPEEITNTFNREPDEKLS